MAKQAAEHAATRAATQAATQPVTQAAGKVRRRAELRHDVVEPAKETQNNEQLCSDQKATTTVFGPLSHPTLSLSLLYQI